MGKNKGILKRAWEEQQAKDAMERGYQRIRFWEKREVKESIKKTKYRDYLIDQDYNRPNIPPERLVVGLISLRTNNSKLRPYEILLLLHLERYEFFTIQHLEKMGFYTRPDKEPARSYRFFIDVVGRLQRMGYLWQPIRDWDLDDEEFKQRFGEKSNRHKYKRRYALNSSGKLLMDRFYTSVGF